MNILKEKKTLNLKVCGMREAKNIEDLQMVNPDFIGFIFYPFSPRYVKKNEELERIQSYLSQIKKVGVFVDTSVTEIKKKVAEYHLDYVQIYTKDVLFCKKLQEENIKIILTIPIETGEELEYVEVFSDIVDYLLFDTKTAGYGGSGKKFNWSLLENYSAKIPFFLSGGIDIEDIDSLKKMKNPYFFGVDVNSKFETSPGMKDIAKLIAFKNNLVF